MVVVEESIDYVVMFQRPPTILTWTACSGVPHAATQLFFFFLPPFFPPLPPPSLA